MVHTGTQRCAMSLQNGVRENWRMEKSLDGDLMLERLFVPLEFVVRAAWRALKSQGLTQVIAAKLKIAQS